MERQARRDIEHFVRGTLGCRCPDGVFRDIALETRTSPEGASRYARIAIGGKLLIYILDPADADPGDGVVVELARLGVAERDRLGFNRFRLAMAAPAGGDPRRAAEAFAGAVGTDGKAHLHAVPARALPTQLRGLARRSPA